MKHALTLACTAALLALALPSAAGQTPFAAMAADYAPIHKALTANSLDGVAERAKAIASTAHALHKEFSAERAGVPAARAAELKEALPEIAAAAEKLAGASDLKSARAAFFALTKPLVLYRGMVEGGKPAVAYCSMEKKSWLQNDGAIENPYDPSMLRCGEIVAR